MIPAEGGSATLGAGLVTQGTYDPCGRFDDVESLDFSFLGRMPAGKSAYQVTAGQGSGSWGCNAGAVIKMTGTTASGTFQWSCWGPFALLIPGQELGYNESPLFLGTIAQTGPTWRFRGTCVTKGKAGRFTIDILLNSLRGDEDPREFLAEYRILGAYVAIAT